MNSSETNQFYQVCPISTISINYKYNKICNKMFALYGKNERLNIKYPFHIDIKIRSCLFFSYEKDGSLILNMVNTGYKIKRKLVELVFPK